MFLIVIATSEPRQLYIQILLNPEIYSPFLKHVTAASATIIGYIAESKYIYKAVTAIFNFFIVHFNITIKLSD